MSQSCIFHGPVAACIHVSGGDALAFLNSQMTVSIPYPQEMQWTYGLWLNESGRILADSYVFAQEEDSCLVWSFYCSAKHLMNTINRNLVADQVGLTDLTADFEFSVLHLEATRKGSRSQLEAIANGNLPDPQKVRIEDDYFLMGGSPLKSSDFLFIAQPDFHKKLQQTLSNLNVYPIDGRSFEFERIAAGLPAIPIDLNHRNLPQEGRFPEPVVDYQKGCFPGQEIMAKFRKGGKLNKRIQIFQLELEREGDSPDFETPLEIRSGNTVVGSINSIASDGINVLGIGLLRERAFGKPLSIEYPTGKLHQVNVVDNR